MGEYAAKFRPEVDLDEFERRLRAAAPAAQPAPEASDPLAELARLVGGETANRRGDPFEALFRAQTAIADVRAAAQARPAEPEQAEVAPYGLHEPYFDEAAHYDQGAPAQQMESGADEAYAHHAHYAGHESEAYAGDPLPYQESDPAWTQEAAAGPAVQETWPAAFSDDASAEPAPRIRRKVMYGMAAVLALGVAAIGVTLGVRGKSGKQEVVTIQADTDPAKIKPAQAEGAATPEGQALFDRKGGTNVSKVVGNAEQPADLGAALKTAQGNSKAAGAAGVATPAPPAVSTSQASQSDSIFPTPKKVKTVSVRADGSVINGPDAAPPVASALPTMAAGAPAPDVAPAAPTRTPAPKSTQRATSTNEAALKSPAHAKPSKPEPAVKETAGEGGGYAVQLAGTPSESEARAAATRLSAKYSSALQGHHATFVQAKVGDKTVYRVRVGRLTEEGAKSMCSAIKAQGGSCFIAKN